MYSNNLIPQIILYLVFVAIFVYSTKALLPVITPSFIYHGFKKEQPPESYRVVNFLAVVSGYILSYYVFFASTENTGLVNLIQATKSSVLAAFVLGLIAGALLIVMELRSSYANLAHAPAVFVLTILFIPSLDFSLWSSGAFVIASFAKVVAVCLTLWLKNFHEFHQSGKKHATKNSLNSLLIRGNKENERINNLH